MMNNNDNNNHNNFYRIMAYVFIGLFPISLVICFCMFIYFKWFKSKYTNNNNKIYTNNYKNEYGIIKNKKSILLLLG